jgi:hypothetical protein
MHYVAVGEDQPVRSEHKSRAAALTFARLSRPRAPGGLMHFNIHHRRTHALNRAGHRGGIGVEQGIVNRDASRDPGLIIPPGSIRQIQRRKSRHLKLIKTHIG